MGNVGSASSLDGLGDALSMTPGTRPRLPSFPNTVIGYFVVPMHARECFCASTAHTVVARRSAGLVVAIPSLPSAVVSRAVLASLLTPVDVQKKNGPAVRVFHRDNVIADPVVVLSSLVHLFRLLRSGRELWWWSFPTSAVRSVP